MHQCIITQHNSHRCSRRCSRQPNRNRGAYIYIYILCVDRTGALVCGTPCRRCSHTWNHQGVAISTKLYSMTSLILHHWFPTTIFDHKHPSWAQTDPTAFAGREQLFAGSIFVDFRWPSRTMTMEWTKHLEHVEACPCRKLGIESLYRLVWESKPSCFNSCWVPSRLSEAMNAFVTWYYETHWLQ